MVKTQTLRKINGVFVPVIDETEEALEMPEEQIQTLKQQLAESDYKAIKYAEGWYSAEEYAPIKAQRQALRYKINELERENEQR